MRDPNAAAKNEPFDSLRALANQVIKSKSAVPEKSAPAENDSAPTPDSAKDFSNRQPTAQGVTEQQSPKALSAKKAMTKGITKCLTALSADSLKQWRVLKTESMCDVEVDVDSTKLVCLLTRFRSVHHGQGALDLASAHSFACDRLRPL